MRERFTKIGFILAAIGSAIGLGNIWRFPYVVGESGGGAFFIPYFLAILLFAMPVMFIEFAMGKKYKKSAFQVFKNINPKIKYLAYIPVFGTLLILSYYLVITGWTFAYFVFSILGYMTFDQFTNTFYPLLFFVFTLTLTAYIVHKGIKKGIEKTCSYLLPALFILILVLVVKAVTLPNAIEGIKFYLMPDFSKILLPEIWVTAFGQAFYSLSVGFTILLTYASYMRKDESIQKSGTSITIADTLIAILAGFIIFPIVFSFGFDPAAGIELSFTVLPAIFTSMKFGLIFGAVFFLLLFIGALTTTISLFEVGVSHIMENHKIKRDNSVGIVLLILFLFGIPAALSYSPIKLSLFGEPLLDIMDYLFGTLLVLLSGALICVIAMWFNKDNSLIDEINKDGIIKSKYFLKFMLKFAIPLILVILVVFNIIVH